MKNATRIIVIGIFVLAVGASLGSMIYGKSGMFVRGVYSKYCYRVGEENSNIKKKLYFKTLSECGFPLYKGN